MAVFLALAALSLMRHMRLESAEDLAMFDQMLWSVRQGQGLITSISGNSFLQFPHHFFGEHVSPILYLLAWPAGLTRGPEALLVIQALALALAAFPLRRLTERLTGSPRLAALAAVTWLLQPALWSAVLYDFHMEVFEAFFLFSFALAFIAGGWQAWLWGALYAACKEDAPIYLAGLAVALGWSHGRLRAGLAMAAAAGAYAVAAVVWIGPAFSPTDAPLLQSRLVTPSGTDGLWSWVQLVLLHGPRWVHLLRHLLALGLLPLLGGSLLVPAAMAVGIMWISNAEPQALILLHYPLTVHPPLAIAAVAGLARAARFTVGLRRPASRALLSGAGVVLVAASLVGLWREQARTNPIVNAGRTPLFDPSYREARRALASIPAGEQVAALPSLSAHLARREHLDLLFGGKDADWLAMRFDGIGYPLNQHNYFAWLDRLLAPGSGYGVANHDGAHVVLLQRSGATERNVAAHASPRRVEAEDLKHEIGEPALDPLAHNGRAWRAGMKQRRGYLTLGPQLQLEPGSYRVGFHVRTAGFKPGRAVQFDVSEAAGATILGATTLERSTRGYEWIELMVAVSDAGAVEFRCRKDTRGIVWLDAVQWQRLDVRKDEPRSGSL